MPLRLNLLNDISLTAWVFLVTKLRGVTNTNKHMDIKQATEGWLIGRQYLPVTFQKSRAERIKWRDKESRAMVEAPMLSHTVSTADGDFIIVQERVADTFKETEYKSPFVRGTLCILEFTSLFEERGVKQARGAIIPLTK